MASAENSWAVAERNIFNKLVEVLEAQEGRDAFLGGVPPSVFDVWSFEIQGGSDGFHIVPGGQINAWEMGARWVGVYRDRARAQLMAGKVRNVLPYEDSGNNIDRLDWTGHPQLDIDPASGAWVVTYPLMAAFRNTEE